mgnify:CR=1 FL=1
MLENLLNVTPNLNFDVHVLYNLLISILCGLAIRFALPFCNQNWVQTLQHTLSYAMLPPITFIITKVISGNIALSLGMVGALSIVRFRTPVKNPLELVIFFALITIGISGAVKIKFGIFLTLVIIGILFAIKCVSLILHKYKYEKPSLIYSEGNSYNTIELTAKNRIQDLENEKNLVQIVNNYEENIYIYKFATSTSESAKKILKKIEKYDSQIKTINSNFIN